MKDTLFPKLSPLPSLSPQLADDATLPRASKPVCEGEESGIVVRVS